MFYLLVLFSTFTYAQEKSLTMDEKIIIMLENEKKISANKERIYRDQIENPFRDKDYGIEINLPQLAMSFMPEYHAFYGTFSIFDSKQKAEIAFPFLTHSVTYAWDNINETKYDLSMIDIHYRKFLGDYLNGFYVSGFARATYIKGLLGEDFYYEGEEIFSGKYGSEKKLGFGFGIGYRIFTQSDFYWGVSLIVGRYVYGENNKFADEWFIEDSEYIVDIEFLKLGYAF